MDSFSVTDLDIDKIVADRLPFVCPLCGCHRERLERHHKDGNHANNDPTNILDICDSCHDQLNYHPVKERESPPTQEAKEDRSEGMMWQDINYEEGPATMKVTRKSFPAFVQWIMAELITHPFVMYDRAETDGSVAAKCSPQVVKYHYLKKLCAENGPLKRDEDDRITFRREWLDANPDVSTLLGRKLLLPLSDVEGGD